MVRMSEESTMANLTCKRLYDNETVGVYVTVGDQRNSKIPKQQENCSGIYLILNLEKSYSLQSLKKHKKNLNKMIVWQDVYPLAPDSFIS